MQKATDIIVEVSSHSDSLGNVEYNKKLSQERADNVVKYLVSKGISKKRLVAKGYGSEKPIAPNTKPDGSDNPEGREKNRRSEFRVVGTLSSQTEDIDTEETQ
jgi:outer membrane protein OmpA-like peptidoglycan-associated protein